MKYQSSYVWLEVEGLYPYNAKQTISFGSVYFCRHSYREDDNNYGWNKWERVVLEHINSLQEKSTITNDTTLTDVSLIPTANNEYYYGELTNLSLSFEPLLCVSL